MRIKTEYLFVLMGVFSVICLLIVDAASSMGGTISNVMIGAVLCVYLVAYIKVVRRVVIDVS